MIVYRITNTTNGNIRYALDRKGVKEELKMSHQTICRLFARLKDNIATMCLGHIIQKVEVDQTKLVEAISKITQ